MFSTKGTFDNGHIDHIIVARPRGKLPDSARLSLGERLDLAPRQEPRQRSLRASTPTFGKHGRWHDGYQPSEECRPVQRPEQTRALVGRDQAPVS
jgi:hypothetical protein